MRYKKELERMFNMREDDLYCEIGKKYEYLGEFVFDFETDSPSMSQELSRDMCDVLDSILNKTTFEYIEDKAQYKNFIIMINMPFLNGNLECGTSVRGSWFDDWLKPKDFVHEFDCGEIEVPKGEFEEFIKQLLEWVKE